MEFFITLQMMILLGVTVSSLFIPVLFIYHFLNSKSKPSSTTTTTSAFGFKTYPFIGVLPEWYKNRRRYLEWTTEVLSDCPTNTSRFKIPGRKAVILTADPSNVEHIFRTRSENYVRDRYFTSALEDFFGHGPFTSDGSRWKNQRNFAAHEFNTKSLKNFWTENVLELQKKLVSSLLNAARTGEILDLQHVFHCFGFDNVCKIAFDVDPGCLGDEKIQGSRQIHHHDHHEYIMHAFGEALTLSLGRARYPFKVLYKMKRFLNVGSEKRLAKSTRVVHEFVEKQINDRLNGKCPNVGDRDFLSRFMDKMMSRGSNVAEYFVKDNLIALIFAGSDTTSSALTWFFWLVSKNPGVKNKIRRELEEIRARALLRKTKKTGDADYYYTYDLDDLQEMNYLQAAISESMRLYPPTVFEMTLCGEDDVLPDGTFVGKNWNAGYNAYAMGRMEKIWGKDCEEYKPERWLLENGSLFRPDSPFRYPIFHVGPRMCLGRDLAYVQMKSVAAVLLERFELELLLESGSGKSPEYLVSFTLRMKGGLPVRVKERK